MSKMKNLDIENQEVTRRAGVMITGSQIPKARLLILRSGLKIELSGMKVSRGVSIYSVVKKEFNLKGNKQSVYEQFNKIVTGITGIAQNAR